MEAYELERGDVIESHDGEIEAPTRVPILCECGQGDPPEHVICSECGDDWDDCVCGAPDDEDAPWMLGID